MSTKLFFRSTTSDWSRGAKEISSDGSTIVEFIPRSLASSAGAGATTATRTSILGPTAGLDLLVDFYSPPLDADITISQSILFNLWGNEASMLANAAINATVHVVNGKTGVNTLIHKTVRTTELGTGSSVQSWSETPAAGVACNKGDRFRVVVFMDDSVSATMASGHVLTFTYNGGTGGADGDSYITFTDTPTFASEPAGTQLFLTDTASAVATAAVDREAWTSRGGGVQTDVTNTGSDGLWTGPIPVTDTAGSSWTTNPQGTSQLNAIAYGNGYWVMVGATGTTCHVWYHATNPTGTWTENTPGSVNSLFGVAYGNGYWVAVGTSGSLIYRATDPTSTWTSNAQGSTTFLGVYYANGYWVAVGSSGVLYYKALTPDGAWTSNTQGSSQLESVYYANGYWVAVGATGTLYHKAVGADSAPSGSWTSNTQGSQTLNSVVYGNGYWVTVSQTGVIWYAADPTGSWSYQVVNGTYILYSVWYDSSEGIFVTVGSAAGGWGWYIDNPSKEWRAMNQPDNSWTGVSFGNGYWAVCGTSANYLAYITAGSIPGAYVDWFTRPLTAFTLSGAVRCNIRAAESNDLANVAMHVEISVVNNDGSSPVVWAKGTCGTELTTSEAAYSFLIAGDDYSVSNGQRLRIRLCIDDAQAAAMASGYTATLYYAGSAGATGDTYVTLSQSVTEYIDVARVPYFSSYPQLLAH